MPRTRTILTTALVLAALGSSQALASDPSEPIKCETTPAADGVTSKQANASNCTHSNHTHVGLLSSERWVWQQILQGPCSPSAIYIHKWRIDSKVHGGTWVIGGLGTYNRCCTTL